MIPQLKTEIAQLLSYLAQLYMGEHESIRDIDELNHDLVLSINALFDYQNQLKRNFLQSSSWDLMMEQDCTNEKEDTAYCTMGSIICSRE